MHKISKQNLEELENRQRANIVNSLSGYKSPILIGSYNQDSKENLALFSNIFHIGSSPALLGIFFRPATQGTHRHTLENILATKTFTMNFLDSKMIEQAHQTSARYSREESEFLAAGLDSIYRDKIKAPFVKESPLSIEMKFEEHINVQTNNTSIIIASIQSIYSKSSLINNQICELEKHSSIVVKGLDTYLDLNTQEITRLKYAKVDREITHV